MSKNKAISWGLSVMLCFQFAACTTQNSDTIASETEVSEQSNASEEIYNEDAGSSESTKQEIENIKDSDTNKFKDSLFYSISNSEIIVPERLLDKLTKDTLQTIQEGNGNFVATQSCEYALLGWQGYCYFLCIVNGSNIVFYPFGETFRDFSELYLADIDGDGLDEIIAHFYTMAARGPSSASCVLKYENSEITALLYADGTNIDENQINCPDLGFEVTYRDGYQYCIANVITGYEKIVDVRNEEGPWGIIFDDNGNINIEHPLYGSYFERDKPSKNLCLQSNFLIFQPIDFDHDGIFEIIAAQDFEQNMQLYYGLGTSYGILKYNPQSNTFDVIKALFLSTEEHPILDLNIPEQLLY